MTRDIFLDEKGNADPKKSRDSRARRRRARHGRRPCARAEKYGSGKFTLAELIAPAIALARDGFPVEDDLADSLRALSRGSRAGRLRRRSFSSATARRLRAGDRLVQADLAASLRRSRSDGPRAFYEGAIAERMVDALPRRGRHHDARRPQKLPRDRARRCAAAIAATRSLSMPPPSSGGVVLVQMLNILEGYEPARRCGPRPAHA